MRLSSALSRTIQCSVAVLLVSSAWAETAVKYPHPLSHHDTGRIGGTDEPPPDDEIRRNAHAVFGFELSGPQFEKTKHWKTSEFQWWTNGAREDQAQNAVAEIYRVTGLHDHEGELRTTLRDSIDLFGVEVREQSVGGTGSTSQLLTVTVDPKKRPDLASYRDLLFKVLERFAKSSKDGEPNQVMFYQLFP
ncbi:MAG: hypothetical protein AAF604_01405 [Acidobacteriota bacterium]